jgi:C-terminal processing protease CtpA/Prc
VYFAAFVGWWMEAQAALIRPCVSIGHLLLVGSANVASPYFSIPELLSNLRTTWRSLPKSLVKRHRRHTLSNQSRQPSGQTKPARIVYHEVHTRTYCHLLEPPMSTLLSAASMCVIFAAAVPQRVDQGSDSARVARLAAVGRLWATVNVFHPYVASRPIDWDSALIRAIPRVNAASGAAAFRQAVEAMLATLRDPATRVAGPPPASATQAPEWTGSWLPDSTWLIQLQSPATLEGLASLSSMQDTLNMARGAIFDLRLQHQPSDASALPFILEYSGILRRFLRDTLLAPSTRGRMYAGLPPPPGEFSSGGYFDAWYTIRGARVVPADTGAGLPLAFIVNHHTRLPSQATALLATGKASLIAVGPLSDAVAAETIPVRLTDGLTAQVRITEIVWPDGTLGWSADTVLSDKSADSIAVAVAAQRLHRSGSPRSGVFKGAGATRAERIYAESTYPSLELRLLGAFRMWSVVRWFNPYRHLMHEDWDQVLLRFIPRLEAAADSVGYALTIAEMWTQIHDSHGFVRSDVVRAWVGLGFPPVDVRMIQGAPTVTGFVNASAAKAAGIAIGDVIITVDGEVAKNRLDRLRPVTPGGTPQALSRDVAYRLLRGPDSSVAVVQVRGADGRVRSLNFRRSRDFIPTAERTEPILRLLPGNIGYVDLDRLEPGMVDSMFTMFRSTQAIIFDMRGYPRGTAWVIGPRLTSRRGVAAARFERPTPMGRDTTEVTTTSFLQRLPESTGAVYHGVTVMLIDERTQSQAEHTGLFFKAANGTVLIGSPSAGANGDETRFAVPGRIMLSISGQAVRYPDGRELQGVGLLPDVTVHPTLRGIRAGQDEVLQRALSWCQAHPRTK